MKTDAQIRARVMRRVYAMYWARELKKPAPRIAFVSALVLGLSGSVSIVNVAVNALSVAGAADLAAFFVAAFLGTTAAVQAMTVALVGSVGWFFLDAFRKVRSAIIPEQEVATAGVQ